MDKIEVKVGQIWEDWDSRTRDAGYRRKLKVVEIVDGKAVVQHPSGRGNKTRVRLDRFRPTANGYKLVSE